MFHEYSSSQRPQLPQPQLNEALFDSEDASTVNTSFVERLNLTIRQGCSYRSRRSAGHLAMSVAAFVPPAFP